MISMSGGVPIVTMINDRGLIWNSEEGFKIFSLGYFGKPIGVNKPKMEKYDKPLELSLYEIIYLLKQGKIKVVNQKGEQLSIRKITKVAKKVHRDFINKYRVYEDLREKGLIVRPGLKFGADFAVYRYGPGIDHAPFLVTVYSEDVTLLGIDLVRAGRLATSVRKKFVIATIKGRSNIKYFVFQWFRP